MAALNKVMLIGNMTRDIQLRDIAGGTKVGEFGFAINRKRGADKADEVTFVDCTAWGKSAETLEKYTAKGSQLFIEGRLSFSNWTAQDGSKRSKLAVTVEQFQFLGSKDSKPQDALAPSDGKTRGVPDDEIPF